MNLGCRYIAIGGHGEQLNGRIAEKESTSQEKSIGTPRQCPELKQSYIVLTADITTQTSTHMATFSDNIYEARIANHLVYRFRSAPECISTIPHELFCLFIWNIFLFLLSDNHLGSNLGNYVWQPDTFYFQKLGLLKTIVSFDLQSDAQSSKLASAADKIAEVDDGWTLPQSSQHCSSSSLLPGFPASENHLVDLPAPGPVPTYRVVEQYHDRELLALYLAVKHFQPLLEGRLFTIRTDHKPLIHGFKQKSNGTEPWRIRQLNYISQFTTKISHISSSDNVVADSLSRMEEITLSEDPDTLAQEQQADSELSNLRVNPQLQLKSLTIPGSNCSLIFETSTAIARPYIPKLQRVATFHRILDTSHPGIRATRRLIARRYFWPSMNANVARWTRACILCQRSKVGRHTVAPIGVFPPAGRFEHVHLNIIGPLPPSQGKAYRLTMINRCTRWPEAAPIRETSAETIARAFYELWISRFGVPPKITTDQCRQFESLTLKTDSVLKLFTKLATMLGIQRLHIIRRLMVLLKDGTVPTKLP
ncbi:hypothetical protein AAG570_008406 [Ranatra chinensis]|uniref:RNA-directed DNA polymerase n=1 Tax=Ranatra chinensis TaxID=642074 RepID=A0ABD0Z1L4_9HEMI